MFSDLERSVRSQINGVVFACNYLGFNVLGVVMARYEVFFHGRIVVSQGSCDFAVQLVRDERDFEI